MKHCLFSNKKKELYFWFTLSTNYTRLDVCIQTTNEIQIKEEPKDMIKSHPTHHNTTMAIKKINDDNSLTLVQIILFLVQQYIQQYNASRVRSSHCRTRFISCDGDK